MRVGIILACTECKNRNYASIKNKKNNPDRLEIKSTVNFVSPFFPKETNRKVVRWSKALMTYEDVM